MITTREFFEHDAEDIINTVSYTHLDVYKRQIFSHAYAYISHSFSMFVFDIYQLCFYAVQSICLLYTSRCV